MYVLKIINTSMCMHVHVSYCFAAIGIQVSNDQALQNLQVKVIIL